MKANYLNQEFKVTDLSAKLTRKPKNITRKDRNGREANLRNWTLIQDGYRSKFKLENDEFIFEFSGIRFRELIESGSIVLIPESDGAPVARGSKTEASRKGKRNRTRFILPDSDMAKLRKLRIERETEQKDNVQTLKPKPKPISSGFEVPEADFADAMDNEALARINTLRKLTGKPLMTLEEYRS